MAETPPWIEDEQRSKRRNARTVYLACVLGALGLGVVGWFAFSRPNGASANGVEQAATEPPPDLVDLGQQAGGMYVELTDKDDPDRLVGTIEAASFEPVGPSERTVEEPRAWIFFKDGRSAYIEATGGRFFMPAPNAAPESGLLRGSDGEPVRLRLFEARADGERPDPETTPPLITALFDEPLEFDFRRARVSTRGRFEIDTPEVGFIGYELTAVLNQVRERVELVEVRRGETITFTPMTDEQRVAMRTAQGVEPDEADKPAAKADSGAQASTSPDRPRATGNDAPDPVAALIEHYRVVLLDDVVVTRGTQRLVADRLDLWARLIDNTLEPGAIADLDAGAASAGLPGAAPSTNTDAAATAPATAATPPTTTNDPIATDTPIEPPAVETADAPSGLPAEPVTLAWTGALQITPLGADRPRELGDESLLLRFTAEHTGLVAFEDPASGASGRSASLDYGFTTGTLTMSAPGGACTLMLDESGRLEASRVQFAVIDGVVTVPGPGLLVGADAEPASLRWQKQGRFYFEHEDGGLTSRLTSAELDGTVRGEHAGATFQGDSLSADFVTRDRSTTPEVVFLANGIARNATGDSLRGDELFVEFDVDAEGDTPVPVRVTGRGNVVAQDDEQTLNADGSLVVRLRKGFEGETQVDHASASGGVEYVRADGLTATGDGMQADGITRVVTLLGEGSSVTHKGSTLTGKTIIVDGRQRTARVPGPGTFTHAADTGETLAAEWTQSMRFDDVLGLIECDGDASVRTQREQYTTDTLHASSLSIEITPGGPDGSEGDDRSLLRATAFGTAQGEDGAVPAYAESRAYDPADPERVVQLFYLEGMQLIADALEDRLTVPGAGKLLVLDRRERDGSADPGAEGGLAELAGDGPGLSRFVWLGSMTMDRASGAAVMRRGVDAASKDLTTGRVATLRCDRLVAMFQELDESGTPLPQSAPHADGTRGRLTLAEAFGWVYFASGEGREMTADRLLYDALTGRAVATAAEGREVSVFDSVRGTNTTSAAILWDLGEDRIEVVRPGPVVTPRGG